MAVEPRQNSKEQAEQIKKEEKKTLQRKVAEVKISQQIKISSPLPPPEVLKKYAEINPSFPDRLFKMVEREQKHRHLITLLGEIFSLVVIAGGFISAIVLGIYGKEWLAGTIGLGAISTMVGAYFYGKKMGIEGKKISKEE